MSRGKETFGDALEAALSMAEELHKRSKVTQLPRTPDLLDIAGLCMVPNFISTDEEKALISVIDKQPWNTQLARRTQHYGYIYDYTSKGASAETTPIPSWCDDIVERLLDQKVLSKRPDQLIVNEYIPGQGIYPHVDNVHSFEDGIVTLSLGSNVVMDLVQYRNSTNKKEIFLDRRSVLSFHEDARYEWKHGIAARKSDHANKRGRRLSLTFRKMK